MPGGQRLKQKHYVVQKEKEQYLKLAQKFGSLLMLTSRSIHHRDYTNIQHITQDWFVQLALSSAHRDQSPRLIFHCLEPAEAHMLCSCLVHLGERSEAEQTFSFPLPKSLLLVS